MSVMTDQRGLFIVLEGGEGVGKTTNLEFIRTFLQQRNIPFQSSREPGGTIIAEQIRELILAHHQEPMADITELLLMFAARAQHIAGKILPVIEQNTWLLCDRFTDATYAYQGGGRQLDKSVIAVLEQLVQQQLRPDCVILLDAPVEVGHARARARAALDRMESESLEFHQRVRDAYLERAAQMPDRYAVINADQPLAAVQSDIGQVLQQLIDRWQA